MLIPSTIACGYCSYCRAGYYWQCDNANRRGKQAGTAFLGRPKSSGPSNGLQAEYARIPFANVGLINLPKTISDDQAITEVIDFSREDSVETILALTGGIGADRVIDAVGVHAQLPKGGPVAEKLNS